MVTPKWFKSASPALVVASALAVGTVGARAQTRYMRGQNVVPVFEGWEQNPDGSFAMTFGYFNRNFEEQVDIPVAAGSNYFEPGPADRGQPAHFYPRRNPFMFRVNVPADWGKKELVWTLVFRDRTEKARATLLPVWAIDEAVIRGNRGGNDIGDIPKEYEVDNKPPTISIEGGSQRTIPVDQSISLIADIADDGVEPHPPWLKAPRYNPAPGSIGAPGTARGRGIAAALGDAVAFINVRPVLHPPPRAQRPGVSWTQYRGGPGEVVFSDQWPLVKGGKATVDVRFTQPGTYVLRAYADDGVRTTPADVTVVVTSAGSTSK